MRVQISRLLIGGLLLGALTAAALPLLAPRPPEVDLYWVEKGLLRVQVSEEGKTRVKELFIVASPVPGLMRRVELDAGVRIQAGETVLASIQAPQPRFYDLREASEHKARLAQAQAQHDLAVADIERAKAELAFAESELKRNRDLLQKRAVTQQNLESAELDVRVKGAALTVANNTLKAKTAEVEVAKAALIAPGTEGDSAAPWLTSIPAIAPPETRIVAPVSGVLLRKVKESEAMVTAGDPLFEVGDTDELEIQVEMLSQDAVKVRAGARAVVRDWGGDRELKAVVKRVEPWGFTKISALGIEDQRVNVILEFDEPPDALTQLAHDYRVNVSIDVWEKTVLRLPFGAMFRSGNRWAVYTVDPQGIVHLRKLEIGQMNSQYAEVLSGLEERSVVVLHPSDRIQEGMWVAVPPPR